MFSIDDDLFPELSWKDEAKQISLSVQCGEEHAKIESEKPVPNDLEEAADEYANKHYSEWDESWDDYNGHNIEPENDKLQLMDAFIAGAKWMSIHGNDIKEL